MRDDFNALTEARLERLEERVHSIEVILLLMSIGNLMSSINDLIKAHKKNKTK